MFGDFGVVAILLALPAAVSGYSWTFSNTPEQCQNLSFSISGSGGQPPYSVLILPFGPSPLPNNVEARKIIDKSFPNNGSTLSFQLPYPSDSQFVAVISDSSGFGSGGTSVAAQVLSSSDSSCFNATVNVSPSFVFNINPPNQIVQCSPTRIWWANSTAVQGSPSFLGVIPGGQSFSIPTGTLTDVDYEGTGFDWTPSLRAGTTLLLVGGDDLGVGSAGSIVNTVGAGLNNTSGCLSDTSPSSTPGSPAGGSYPTNSSGGSTGGHGGSTNVGAIVGVVIGGVVFLIALILVLLFFRRKRVQKGQKERPVDLLQDEEGDGNGQHNELPHYYTPEPFVVPDPTRSSAHNRESTVDMDERRPLSGLTSTSRSGTPEAGASSAGTRKTAAGPTRMRAVNVIQHDDAGPSTPKADDEEAETVELPPAYTNLRK